MKISRVMCWVDSQGKAHTTKEQCQVAEVEALLKSKCEEGTFVDEEDSRYVAEVMVNNTKEIADILTLTDTSRPAARGVKKPRKRVNEPAMPLKDKEAA